MNTSMNINARITGNIAGQPCSLQRQSSEDAPGGCDRHPQALSCLSAAEVPPRPQKLWPIDRGIINPTVAGELPKVSE